MIVKFFKYGKTTQGAKAGIEYLLNERIVQGTAKIYAGNPKITLDLIKNINRKWKYTSGAIVFEENYEKVKNIIPKVIEKFEQTFFAGLSRDQYNVLYVLHTDKGRTEIHFVIPRIELTTGKDLSVYTHLKDLKKKDLFQKYISFKYGLSSSADPAKKNSLQEVKKWRGNRARIKEQIHEYIIKAIAENRIRNRNDIIRILEESGIIINRIGKTYISIKISGSGKTIRLKGDFYNENFRDFKSIAAKYRERAIEFEREKRELERIERELIDKIRADAERNRRKYRADERRDIEYTSETELDITPEPDNIGNFDKNNIFLEEEEQQNVRRQNVRRIIERSRGTRQTTEKIIKDFIRKQQNYRQQIENDRRKVVSIRKTAGRIIQSIAKLTERVITKIKIKLNKEISEPSLKL